jgi:prevent-host-death family protein
MNMSLISTAETRKRLADLLNRTAYGKERFVVTRHGKQFVAIVPVEDFSLLKKLRAALKRREVREALDQVARDGGIKWDDIKRDLGLE